LSGDFKDKMIKNCRFLNASW